jgi:hypothetical protein
MKKVILFVAILFASAAQAVANDCGCCCCKVIVCPQYKYRCNVPVVKPIIVNVCGRPECPCGPTCSCVHAGGCCCGKDELKHPIFLRPIRIIVCYPK